jgi:uncharacterized protein YkwD
MDTSSAGAACANQVSKKTVDREITKLMANSNHKANILSPLFSRVGVGTTTSDDGVMVFTTIFTDG